MTRVLCLLEFSAVVVILYGFIFIYDGTLVNFPDPRLPETRCMLHHPVDSGPFTFTYQNNQKCIRKLFFLLPVALLRTW